MNSAQTIERLCGMLNEAQDIIREQAELLEMAGVITQDETLEHRRKRLQNDATEYAG